MYINHAGIFGYLNFLVPRTRLYILEMLVKGLMRVEYRGYDSAGVAFDDGTQLSTTNGSTLQKIRFVGRVSTVGVLLEMPSEPRYGGRFDIIVGYSGGSFVGMLLL